MSTYEISKSSLLSLKAEILRKQEELTKVKSDNKVKIQNLKKAAPLDLKNKGVEQRQARDFNDDEDDLLKKSRSALEAKSKLYDKLANQTANLSEEQIENNRKYLVRFDKKIFNKNVEETQSGSEEENYIEDYEPPKNPDEEWVEYIDCLGRTRTCLRKDLEHMKAKDADLRSTSDGKEPKTKEAQHDSSFAKEPSPEPETGKESQLDSAEESELLSSDMRREMLRQQWEKEEEELRNKSNIHYQDILFSEARTHGVGYYSFSKDEEERAIQQENLKKLREETQQQQKRSQELRAMREKQLAARAKAARNRKRARIGLPPEEEVPEEPKEEPEEKVDEKDKDETEIQEMMEKKKELERKRHVRPWDVGKEGIKEHYEYTQEEWVQKKRKERPAEFAPPRSFRKENKSVEDALEEEPNKNLYFSTKKNQDSSSKDKRPYGSINPYKTTKEDYEKYEKPRSPVRVTPIVNECEISDDDDRLMRDFRKNSRHYKGASESDSDSDSSAEDRGKGVEIAPPPTFDYYGPSGAKRNKHNYEGAKLEDSISAGLKFLREQAEKKSMPNKRDDEMFIM